MESSDNATNNPHLLMTIDDVCEETRLGRTMVYSLIRSRDLSSIQIGRSRRVRREDLEHYLAGLAKL